MVLLGYALALVIGITLGMLGGGGSILTVPVFVYVLHYDPKLAIAMSLPVVGVTSLIGAISHWRAGNVRPWTALTFGAFAMTGAFTAARLSVHLVGTTQIALLGALMLSAAVLMLRDSFRTAPIAPLPGSGTTSLVTLGAVGLAVGGVTGAIGIGGGFLIVPALVVIARVQMREAIGTSLLVIAMTTLAGFAGQPRATAIPVRVVVAFAAIASAGIVGGAQLGRHVNQRILKRAFAVLLLVIAALVLLQNGSRI